jgi:hypothetical protein
LPKQNQQQKSKYDITSKLEASGVDISIKSNIYDAPNCSIFSPKL